MKWAVFVVFVGCCFGVGNRFGTGCVMAPPAVKMMPLPLEVDSAIGCLTGNCSTQYGMVRACSAGAIQTEKATLR